MTGSRCHIPGGTELEMSSVFLVRINRAEKLDESSGESEVVAL